MSRTLGFLSLSVMLGACANTPPGNPTPPSQPSLPAAVTGSAAGPSSTPIPLDTGGTGPKVEPFTRRGSGWLIGIPGEPDAVPRGGDIILNFDATPIQDVVEIVLGQYLGAAYTVDPAVEGSIVYRGSGGLAREDLLPVLEDMLATRNTALVKTADGYRVVKTEDAAALAQPRVISGDTLADGGFRSVIIPLRFVSANDMSEILRSQGIQATVNDERNLLIVAGSGVQVRQVRRLVEIFDVNWLEGMSFALRPMRHANAVEVARELRSIFRGDGDDGDGGAARVLSIERLNAVLVVAPHADLLDEYASWIDRLDRVSGPDGQGLYVYQVQHGRAEDLATVLNDIFHPGPAPPAHAAPAAAAPSGGHADIVMRPTAPEPRPGRGRVRVIADKSNNALLILADTENYSAVQSALRRLDVEPLQVLIEASIIEVILGDELKYGLEWFIRGHSGSATGEGLLNFGLGDTGGAGLPDIGPVVPGFSYVVRKSGQVRLALNALAEDARINVLSSPALMVLNNETATIRVGDEVPIASRSSISNTDPDAPTVNEITYRNTGVLLAVTPRVNVGGMVSMDIDQEVSNVTETTSSNLDSPTFLQRRITSSVAVNSGETIVLGGLIREQQSAGERGIPGLYKIPILGKLFGTTTRTKERTELIVLITPRAIYARDDMRAVTDEYRRKLLGLAPHLPQHRAPKARPAPVTVE